MYYKTHEIETMHEGQYIEYRSDNGTYTVYENGEIVAVYENTYTANKVINGVHRIR